MALTAQDKTVSVQPPADLTSVSHEKKEQYVVKVVT